MFKTIIPLFLLFSIKPPTDYDQVLLVMPMLSSAGNTLAEGISFRFAGVEREESNFLYNSKFSGLPEQLVKIFHLHLGVDVLSVRIHRMHTDVEMLRYLRSSHPV